MTEAAKAHAWEHAKREAPREACGLFVVRKGREEYWPCRNQSDGPGQFIMDPQDWAAAEEAGDIVGVFHSHVFESPEPSEADKVAIEATKLPWFIVNVPTGNWTRTEPSGFRAPLVGRNWAHGVLDCYSLIVDYYREVLSIEIPDFQRVDEWWFKGQNLYLENYEKAGFRAVEDLRKHDVLLMQVVSPVVNHGAIYLGEERMLHHMSRRLSTREIYGGYYQKHTVLILRHEKA